MWGLALPVAATVLSGITCSVDAVLVHGHHGHHNAKAGSLKCPSLEDQEYLEKNHLCENKEKPRCVSKEQKKSLEDWEKFPLADFEGALKKQTLICPKGTAPFCLDNMEEYDSWMNLCHLAKAEAKVEEILRKGKRRQPPKTKPGETTSSPTSSPTRRLQTASPTASPTRTAGTGTGTGSGSGTGTGTETGTGTSHEAEVLGDVALTTATGTDPGTGQFFDIGENVFACFEAGFTSQQDFIIQALGCSDPSDGYLPGGIDTLTAEAMLSHQCGIQVPRFENGEYISLLDQCGGHTGDYHFHERLSCLYESTARRGNSTERKVAGHSTQVAAAVTQIGSFGNLVYGKWEDESTGSLPQLDACGGHLGYTPESPTVMVYHYHVQEGPPFVIACFGPNDDGSLVTVEQCRAYSSGCDDGDEMTVTTSAGSYLYDPWCPCFDGVGSNSATSLVPLAVFASPTTPPPTTTLPAAPAAPSTTTGAPVLYGDPHIKNLAGEKFDVNQPGDYLLLRLPMNKSQAAEIQVRGSMEAATGAPCGLYMKSVNIQGKWFGEQTLHVRSLKGKSHGETWPEGWPFALKISTSAKAGHWIPFRNFSSSSTSSRTTMTMTMMTNSSVAALPETVKVETLYDKDKAAKGMIMEAQAFKFKIGPKQLQKRPSIIVAQGSHEGLDVSISRARSWDAEHLGGLLGTEKHDKSLERRTSECLASKSKLRQLRDIPEEPEEGSFLAMLWD